MPQCSAQTSIRFCPCLLGARSDRALSTTGKVRCRCTPPSTSKTGEVLGKTAARDTSAEFVAFLTDIVVNQPRGAKKFT